METDRLNLIGIGKLKLLLLHSRWPWHVFFWVGYVLFRFWPYYITVKYYPGVYLQYMILIDLMVILLTYVTFWLYWRMFERGKYAVYFFVGSALWIAYLYGRTVFQFYFLRNAPGFQGNGFAEMVLTNIAVIIVYFLFITACKYFKDGFITQQFDSARKQEQLAAEVNNLKSQIAPHFLFNTLNNLYGLAVDKSARLPPLMLQLSEILRHSLYETQKSLVYISDEIKVLKSYIQLESVRLEDDLKLDFDDEVPAESPYQIAPLILIVFIENAFKHAKFVQSEAVNIYIHTSLVDDRFVLIIKNNYNKENKGSQNGIGLTNVRRRLTVLYPGEQHRLEIVKDEEFYTVSLELQLVKST